MELVEARALRESSHQNFGSVDILLAPPSTKHVIPKTSSPISAPTSRSAWKSGAAARDEESRRRNGRGPRPADFARRGANGVHLGSPHQAASNRMPTEPSNFRKLPLTGALCINRSVQRKVVWRTGPAGTLNRRGSSTSPQRFVPIVSSHPRHLRAHATVYVFELQLHPQ